MRRRVLVLGLLLAGCGGEEPGDVGAARIGENGLMRFEVTPEAELVTGVNAFHLVLTDASSGRPMVGAALEVHVFMPGHGHAMPDARVDERGEGRYHVHDCRFGHVGAYEVRYEARAGEIEDAATFTYEVR